MSLALESVFAPVVHGALAAVLAASMLATSEFGFVARLFLRLLLALVLLGLLDGLLFFPIILALLGPAAEVRAYSTLQQSFCGKNILLVMKLNECLDRLLKII